MCCVCMCVWCTTWIHWRVWIRGKHTHPTHTTRYSKMKCILVLCRVENMYQVVVLPIGDRNAGRACAGELRNSCRDAEAIRRKSPSNREKRWTPSIHPRMKRTQKYLSSSSLLSDDDDDDGLYTDDCFPPHPSLIPTLGIITKHTSTSTHSWYLSIYLSIHLSIRAFYIYIMRNEQQRR